MKILIVGKGGRERCISEYLCKHNTENIMYYGIDNTIKYAQENKFELIVVGSEKPLVDGLQDACERVGIKCFGPSKYCSQIEGSKKFCKEFLNRIDIKTPKYKVFEDTIEAINYIENRKLPVVIKMDGLKQGKGVFIANTFKEAQFILNTKNFNNTIIIEEYLKGREVSVLCFTDGNTVKLMPPAQDYKRSHDNDLGLNTGGMGAICPCSLDEYELNKITEIIQNTINEFRKLKNPYKGILYCGLMICQDDIYVLEYNCRFGDPECQVILPLLESDNLFEIIMSCCDSYLDFIDIKWSSKCSLCVVLAIEGYPKLESYLTDEIKINKIIDPKLKIFFMSVMCFGNGKYYGNGGRVVSLVGISDNFEECRNLVYSNINFINYENKYFRKDIGKNVTYKNKITYLDSGVNVNLGNQFVKILGSKVKTTFTKGVIGELGGFGGLFDISKMGYTSSDFNLICSTDGVGTKIKLALELNNLKFIGIDLVAMSVNDIMVQGGIPLLFLDYYAVGKLELNSSLTILNGIIDGCKMCNCALIGGETAEMKDVYKKNDFDLAGFVVGVVQKNRIFPLPCIPSNCILIGFPSNGFHSNGYTLLRKLLKINNIDTKSVLIDNEKLSDLLLQPTKIYYKECMYLKELDGVYAMSHITGGGLIGNINRVLPKNSNFDYHCIDIDFKHKNLKLFKYFMDLSKLEYKEMLNTFNCGYGLVAIVDPKVLNSVIHLGCKIIGKIN